MSKEEYAAEVKKLAYMYNKGIEDERKRIIKLIDKKREWSNSTPKNVLTKAIKNKEIDEIFYRGFHEGFDEALKQLKKELSEKK